MGLGSKMLTGAGKEAEVLDRSRNINPPRQGQGFAGIAAFGFGQLAQADLDAGRDTVQPGRTVGRLERCPSRERLLGRRYGLGHILFVTIGNAGVNRSDRRGFNSHVAALGRRYILPIYKIVQGKGFVGHSWNSSLLGIFAVLQIWRIARILQRSGRWLGYSELTCPKNAENSKKALQIVRKLLIIAMNYCSYRLQGPLTSQ
jgi:hypothetical protein